LQDFCFEVEIISTPQYHPLEISLDSLPSIMLFDTRFSPNPERFCEMAVIPLLETPAILLAFMVIAESLSLMIIT
jgi:hypothetical protein